VAQLAGTRLRCSGPHRNFDNALVYGAGRLDGRVHQQTPLTVGSPQQVMTVP